MRQLVYHVCYTRYHVSFYLWLTGCVLKHCKVPKYYDQDCRKYRKEIKEKFYEIEHNENLSGAEKEENDEYLRKLVIILNNKKIWSL